jgi:hypothetical protein
MIPMKPSQLESLKRNITDVLHQHMNIYTDRVSLDKYVEKFRYNKFPIWKVFSTFPEWDQEELALKISAETSKPTDYDKFEKIVVQYINYIYNKAHHHIITDEFNFHLFFINFVYAGLSALTRYKSEPLTEASSSYFQEDFSEKMSTAIPYIGCYHSRFTIEHVDKPGVKVRNILTALLGREVKSPTDNLTLDDYEKIESILQNGDDSFYSNYCFINSSNSNEPFASQARVCRYLCDYYVNYFGKIGMRPTKLLTSLFEAHRKYCLVTPIKTIYDENLFVFNENYFTMRQQTLDEEGNEVFRTLPSDIASYDMFIAKLCDLIIGYNVQQTFIISINPLDALLMSNGNSWSSCHRLGNGMYCAGSYQLGATKSSIIVYVISEPDKKPYWVQKKNSRQLMFISDDLLSILQISFYPSGTHNGSDSIRKYLQDRISSHLAIENKWTKLSQKNTNYIMVDDMYMGYKDYECKDVIYSTHARFACEEGDIESSKSVFNISEKVPTINRRYSMRHHGFVSRGNEPCTFCGLNIVGVPNRISHIGTVCNDCLSNKVTYCSLCGKRFAIDDMSLVGNKFMCKSCLPKQEGLHKCLLTKKYITDGVEIFDAVSGKSFYVTSSLVEKVATVCSGCGKHYLKQQINIDYCPTCYKSNVSAPYTHELFFKLFKSGSYYIEIEDAKRMREAIVFLYYMDRNIKFKNQNDQSNLVNVLYTISSFCDTTKTPIKYKGLCLVYDNGVVSLSNISICKDNKLSSLKINSHIDTYPYQNRFFMYMSRTLRYDEDAYKALYFLSVFNKQELENIVNNYTNIIALTDGNVEGAEEDYDYLVEREMYDDMPLPYIIHFNANDNYEGLGEKHCKIINELLTSLGLNKEENVSLKLKEVDAVVSTEASGLSDYPL